MLGPTLALAVAVLASGPLPDPTDLVKQLGSARYTLRESAEGELSRLGRVALPALRAAKDSRDPEIRTRASAILARIENSMLVEPTPITLDFRDVPIVEAIEAINRQTGLNLNLSPEERPLFANRRLTLQSKEPLPFWKAIDALCAGAGLHHGQGVHGSSGTFEGSLALHDGYDPLSGPVSDTGPFRVQLSSVHFQSDIQLTQPRELPAIRPSKVAESARSQALANRQFFLQFVVAAEPRLSITQDGPIKLTAVTDDRGQSLLNSPGAGTFQHHAGYFGINPAPTLRLRADLSYPESPGKQIRVIRGSIPLIVATRKPDPLVVSLSDSMGKSRRNEDVDLTLVEYRPARGDQPATIQVAIKPLGAANQPVESGVGEPLGYRPDSPQQQIEILDAEGRILSWFPSSTLYNGEETRLTLTLGSRGTPGVPASLRYHGILRAHSEAAFEFRDIPIP